MTILHFHVEKQKVKGHSTTTESYINSFDEDFLYKFFKEKNEIDSINALRDMITESGVYQGVNDNQRKEDMNNQHDIETAQITLNYVLEKLSKHSSTKTAQNIVKKISTEIDLMNEMGNGNIRTCAKESVRGILVCALFGAIIGFCIGMVG